MKIHHCNGDTYTGNLIDEDKHRIWIKNPGTGRVYQIMKSDILARSEDTPAPLEWTRMQEEQAKQEIPAGFNEYDVESMGIEEVLRLAAAQKES